MSQSSKSSMAVFFPDRVDKDNHRDGGELKPDERFQERSTRGYNRSDRDYRPQSNHDRQHDHRHYSRDRSSDRYRDENSRRDSRDYDYRKGSRDNRYRDDKDRDRSRSHERSRHHRDRRDSGSTNGYKSHNGSASSSSRKSNDSSHSNGYHPYRRFPNLTKVFNSGSKQTDKDENKRDTTTTADSPSLPSSPHLPISIASPMPQTTEASSPRPPNSTPPVLHIKPPPPPPSAPPPVPPVPTVAPSAPHTSSPSSVSDIIPGIAPFSPVNFQSTPPSSLSDNNIPGIAPNAASTPSIPLALIPKKSDTPAIFAKRKEYKIVYDPDINKDKSKGKHAIYKFRDATKSYDKKDIRDPRKREKYSKYASLGKKAPFNSLPIPRFTYDENWIGKPPPTQILISRLSSLTSKSTVASQFKIFGEVESCELILNPDTAASLGMCHLKFKGSIDKAHRLAEKAINECKGIKIDLRDIQVAFDDDGEKGKLIVDKIILAKRKREEAAALEPKKSSEKIEIKAKTTVASRSSTPSTAPSLSSPTKPLQLSLTSFPHIKPAIMKIIATRPYIMVNQKYLPTDDVYPSDIKKALRDYDWVRVLCDDNGFYIIFDSAREARICHEDMDGKKLFEFRLIMDLYLHGFAPRVKGATALSAYHGTKSEPSKSESTNRKDKKKEVKRDEAKIATDRIIKDLRRLLLKDVKERVVAPKIFESLDPDRFPDVKKEEPAKVVADNATTDSITTITDPLSISELPSLPRFKKKSSTAEKSPVKSVKKFRKDVRPMNHRLNFDESDDEKDSEASTRKASPVAESITPSVEPEFEKKKTRLIKKRNLDFSSSSEDEDEKEYESDIEKVDFDLKYEKPPEKKVKISKKKAVKAVVKKKGKPKKIDEDDNEDGEEMDNEIDDELPVNEIDSIPHVADKMDIEIESPLNFNPTESVHPLSVCGEEDTSNFELSSFLSVIKDQEDFDLLLESLSDTKPDTSISNPAYWAWKHLHIKQLEEENRQKLLKSKPIDTPFEMLVGKYTTDNVTSRKSDGYYEIDETDKSEYLQHRRKISKPIDTLQRYDRDSSSLPGATGTSRMNRMNNRRLAADISIQKQMLPSETDIFNFNQLKKRKKSVKFARSAIHNWGLYAVEAITANEMIIEYVGEVIRQQLADLRERNYIQSGIGSSYLFRIDETTVVDATKKGGIARVSLDKHRNLVY